MDCFFFVSPSITQQKFRVEICRSTQKAAWKDRVLKSMLLNDKRYRFWPVITDEGEEDALYNENSSHKAVIASNRSA